MLCCLEKTVETKTITKPLLAESKSSTGEPKILAERKSTGFEAPAPKAEPKPESKPEPKPEPEAEPKPESKPEPKPEVTLQPIPSKPAVPKPVLPKPEITLEPKPNVVSDDKKNRSKSNKRI